MHSRIAGTGSYLPAHILTNDELAKRVDTSDAWIQARTGIRERRLAAPDEKTSDRLKELKVQLDQLWDLLHQRQGLRDAGRDPDQATTRPKAS